MIHCPNNSLDSSQLKIEFRWNNQVMHQKILPEVSNKPDLADVLRNSAFQSDPKKATFGQLWLGGSVKSGSGLSTEGCKFSRFLKSGFWSLDIFQLLYDVVVREDFRRFTVFT